MNYEEDLKYAHSVLNVRLMMERKDPIFSTTEWRDGTLEYRILRDNSTVIFGYLKEQPTRKVVSCISHILIHDMTSNKFLYSHDNYGDIDPKGIGSDWYFQNSLVLEPHRLRNLLVFNVLASVQSEYSYFQLNMRTFNEFIKRMYQ